MTFRIFKSFIFVFIFATTYSSQPCFALTLIIMRHGEGKQNVAQILNSDVANSQKFTLTPTGEDQVHAAAKRMKQELGANAKNVQTIYVSPLKRTRQTAEILAQDLGIAPTQIVVEDLLRENGMGQMEGHKESDLNSLDSQPGGYLARAKSFGGETRDEVILRLQTFLTKIKSSSSPKVIVVTHGTPASELLKLADPGHKDHTSLGRGEFKVVDLKN